MKFDKDFKNRNRSERLIYFFGDIVGLTTKTQARKWWTEQNRIAKEKENAIKIAKKEAIKIQRELKATPSRKYSGKHDKQVRELEL